MKSKWINRIYTHYVWIVLGALLLGFLSFNILRPEMSIDQVVKDFHAWVHTIFVITMNVTMVVAAYDTGTQRGTESQEFDEADKLNNILVEKYNQNQEDFRQFIKVLNYQERKTLEDEFLFAHGVDSAEELGEKELKEFQKLKPLYHNIIGFNLPLYYEATKDGKIDYKASEKKNEGKTRQMVIKGFMGFLFSAMTINMSLKVHDVGGALLAVVIIAIGLLVTFLTIFAPRFHKFKNELPKKVMHKKALFDSYANKDKIIRVELLKELEAITSDLTHENIEVKETPAETVDNAII